MTQRTYVVAYEGDAHSSTVLDYAVQHALEASGTLNIVHVLEWSPFQFLTPEEIEERAGKRKEELERAEEAIMKPALDKARSAGVEAVGTLKFGNVVDLVSEAATECAANAIFVGRSGANSITARIFGSVPLGLAQIATVPTVIIP